MSSIKLNNNNLKESQPPGCKPSKKGKSNGNSSMDKKTSFEISEEELNKILPTLDGTFDLFLQPLSMHKSCKIVGLFVLTNIRIASSPEIIEHQATINVGTLGHVGHGKR
jgi:hypothetical protein